MLLLDTGVGGALGAAFDAAWAAAGPAVRPRRMGMEEGVVVVFATFAGDSLAFFLGGIGVQLIRQMHKYAKVVRPGPLQPVYIYAYIYADIYI